MSAITLTHVCAGAVLVGFRAAVNKISFQGCCFSSCGGLSDIGGGGGGWGWAVGGWGGYLSHGARMVAAPDVTTTTLIEIVAFGAPFV